MQPDVIVVGAGLAGLIAARTARDAGARVLVLDPHPGGRARTDLVEGVPMNRGPRAVPLGGAAEQVLGELGVVLAGSPAPTAHARAWDRGRLSGLPVGPGSLAATSLLGPRDKVAYGMFLQRARGTDPSSLATTTIGEWTAALPSAVRRVAHALVRLITYADLPETQSADVVVATLRQGGAVRYLDGGWQSMVDQLRAGVTVEPMPVTAVGEHTVVTPDGEHRAAAIVVAVGTPQAAFGLLGRDVPDQVGPAATVSSLDIGLADRRAVRHRFVLGIDEPLYASLHPARVLHVARYGGGDRDGLRAHAERCGITAGNVIAQRYLHRMTVVGAIPVAASGGLAGRVTVDGSGVEGVLLAGDWVGPEGNLLDAVAASGRVAGRRAAALVGAA